MRDRRTSGHDVSRERRRTLSGQFEHRGRLGEECSECVARCTRREILLIVSVREWQDGAEREPGCERDLRRDLVCTFGQRRNQMKLRRARREEGGVLRRYLPDARHHVRENVGQPLCDAIAFTGDELGPMPRHPEH